MKAHNEYGFVPNQEVHYDLDNDDLKYLFWKDLKDGKSLIVKTTYSTSPYEAVPGFITVDTKRLSPVIHPKVFAKGQRVAPVMEEEDGHTNLTYSHYDGHSNKHVTEQGSSYSDIVADVRPLRLGAVHREREMMVVMDALSNKNYLKRFQEWLDEHNPELVYGENSYRVTIGNKVVGTGFTGLFALVDAYQSSKH